MNDSNRLEYVSSKLYDKEPDAAIWVLSHVISDCIKAAEKHAISLHPDAYRLIHELLRESELFVTGQGNPETLRYAFNAIFSRTYGNDQDSSDPSTDWHSNAEMSALRLSELALKVPGARQDDTIAVTKPTEVSFHAVETVCQALFRSSHLNHLSGTARSAESHRRAEKFAASRFLTWTSEASPSEHDVKRARDGKAVAWDMVHDRPGRIGSLTDALRRAHDLELNWGLSVDRAIAERCYDVALFSDILNAHKCSEGSE